MADYAIINATPEGVVQEIFITDLIVGVDILTPETIAIDVTTLSPKPVPGWFAHFNGDAWSFNAPPPIVPTSAEVLAANSEILQHATQLAAAQKTALTERISTLNDAVELEMATPAEIAELPVRTTQLKAWKTYAILLGRVTMQAGWHMTPDWPVAPAQGMDLTTSAARPADAS